MRIYPRNKHVLGLLGVSMQRSAPVEFWGEYHSSMDIVGTRDSDIKGKCIALAVTGGASIYKSIDLARLLMRMGAIVRVVMSKEATKLVSPTLFEWATGYPVITELTGQIEHIALAQHCDAVVVAPATLNTMADIAFYRASTAVTAMVQEAIGRGKKVLILPAMHVGMWNRAKKIIKELETQGVIAVPPLIEEDKAKYPPIDIVAWWIETILVRGRDLKGNTILVTAGPTREHIDPIRIVTNPSTGKMGASIAIEALIRGASVILIHGPLCPELQSYIIDLLEERTYVETTDEMADAVIKALNRYKVSIAFYAAAVADYKPAEASERKIPSGTSLELKLVPTRKVIAEAVKVSPSTLHVGFAAETARDEDELINRAQEKLEKYKLDIIAANNVSKPGVGFGHETNELTVLSWRGLRWRIPKLPKRMVARRLIDIAVSQLHAGALRPRSM